MSSKVAYSLRDSDDLKEDLFGPRTKELIEISKTGVQIPQYLAIQYIMLKEEQGVSDILAYFAENSETLGKEINDPHHPLFLTISTDTNEGSSERFSGIGLNLEILQTQIAAGIPANQIWEAYFNFLFDYATKILKVPQENLDSALKSFIESHEYGSEADFSPEDWESYCQIIKTEEGETAPQECSSQLNGIINYLADQINSGGILISIFNIQAEGFICGRCTSRDPKTCDANLTGHFGSGITFEDFVSGDKESNPIAKLEGTNQEIFDLLKSQIKILETKYKSIQEVDFVIDSNDLGIISRRTIEVEDEEAKFKLYIDFAKEDIIPKSEIIEMIQPSYLESKLQPHLDEGELHAAEGKLFVQGKTANESCSVGAISFSIGQSEDIILVQRTFTIQELNKIQHCKGLILADPNIDPIILSYATQCQVPVVYGIQNLKIEPKKQLVSCGEASINEGDEISLDGFTGSVYSERISIVSPVLSELYGMSKILQWADQVRIKPQLFVDSPEDFSSTRTQGICLYRTEQALLGEKASLIQGLMDPNEEEEDDHDLEEGLLSEYSSIIEAAGSSPVMIQLFDSTLAAFLPELPEADDEEEDQREKLAQKYRRFHQTNPIIGCRGVRTHVLLPKLLAAQLKPIVEAVCNSIESEPNVFILLPFVCLESEVLGIRELLSKIAAPIFKEREVKAEIKIGVVIDVPRACLQAGSIAKHVDCLVFDFDVLQQISFGLEANESSQEMLRKYQATGIFNMSPFAKLDVEGVGKLVGLAIERAKEQNEGIIIGAVGDACADQETVSFCRQKDMNFVSTKQTLLDYARLYTSQGK